MAEALKSVNAATLRRDSLDVMAVWRLERLLCNVKQVVLIIIVFSLFVGACLSCALFRLTL